MAIGPRDLFPPRKAPDLMGESPAGSYGRAVVAPGLQSDLASQSGDNTALAMKSVVADLRCYDWEGDNP